ncbi:DUF4241 domain-containing protein [Hymenobacter rubripertinctus]|uniref:DUF4241 domain-containing protein n=1 Tax=Hymenobacter rubripertinctus TaxID=2029981 RepID=UPI001602B5BA
MLSPGRPTVGSSPYAVQAEPAIFETSFFPATRVEQNGVVFELQRQLLGNLPIGSGRIIAASPVGLSPATAAFTTAFPRGRFPVELAVAHFNGDERVAFARILFSAQPVVTWQLALLPGQKTLPVYGEEFYGYPVDGGCAFFPGRGQSGSVAPITG